MGGTEKEQERMTQTEGKEDSLTWQAVPTSRERF